MPDDEMSVEEPNPQQEPEISDAERAYEASKPKDYGKLNPTEKERIWLAERSRTTVS